MAPVLDNDDHGSVTIGSTGGSGRVTGFVQLLACNYGEKSEARSLVPAIERPLQSFHSRVDWRLSSSLESTVGGALGRSNRPKCRVRARPLAESNKDVAHLLEVSHVVPRTGTLGRSGAAFRASNDDRCITYDELFLLFKRFRGPGRSLIG